MGNEGLSTSGVPIPAAILVLVSLLDSKGKHEIAGGKVGEAVDARGGGGNSMFDCSTKATHPDLLRLASNTCHRIVDAMSTL